MKPDQEDRREVNYVDLVEGSFRTRLVGSRVTYAMTPLNRLFRF